MMLPGIRLFRAILTLPAHGLVEIDVVAVEFGALHASEARLAGHGDAAGAAHAGDLGCRGTRDIVENLKIRMQKTSKTALRVGVTLLEN